jgi:hypothetical protein
VDQGQAEFLGFLALVVIMPVVAFLRLAWRIQSPFVAFTAIATGGAGLSATAGALYGVAFGQPEMNWPVVWVFGGVFGGVAGAGCGLLRAIELARRPVDASNIESPDAHSDLKQT